MFFGDSFENRFIIKPMRLGGPFLEGLIFPADSYASRFIIGFVLVYAYLMMSVCILVSFWSVGLYEDYHPCVLDILNQAK